MTATTVEQLTTERSELLKQAQGITGKAVAEGRGLNDDERKELEKVSSSLDAKDGAIEAKRQDDELVKRFAPIADVGTKGGDGAEGQEWRGDIGDYFIKSAAYKQLAERWRAAGKQRFSTGIETPFVPSQLKAPFLIGDNLGAGNSAYPPPLVGDPLGLRLRPITVPQLLGQGSMDNTSLTYWQQLTGTPAPGGTVLPDTGAPGYTLEGGTKKELTVTGEMVTELLAKIAGWTKMSDETVEDAPAVASIIRSQLLARLDIAEENAILNGPGGQGALTGILNRSGILTVVASTEPAANGSNYNALLYGMTLVSTTAFFPADAIVINPLDYFAARTGADANGQYFGGGPFTGAYGNSGLMSNPGLWGVQTVVTPAIAQGTALVGNFGVGGQVFRKGGTRVETANQNEDDFINDLITVRAESRLLLACYYPSAFAEVTLDGAWG